MGDGLLDTRSQKLRSAVVKTVYGTGPSLLLAGVILALGGGATGWAFGFVGVLLGLSIATSVRTERGALIAGLIVVAGLLLLQVAFHWLFSHPILPGA